MEVKTFPGTLDSLEPIRDYVKKLAQDIGLEKKSVYNLLLAIDEVATNIINYGYDQAGLKGNVDVITQVSNNEFKVILDDTATPFDPLKRDLPDKEDFNKPLEERPIGGLGIYLTITGVDKFYYEFKNNHNRNFFVMKIKK